MFAIGTAVAQENLPEQESMPGQDLAIAPESTSSERAYETQLEEVTTTGTRVVRDGFESPTPVTVLSGSALDAMAVTVVADAVNRLPMFSGSITTRNASTTISGGSAGVNTLNLRGLGPNRTLTLLNGKRVVTSQYRNRDNNGGAVDTNEFPSGLIERVEVVTGGASAAYGSDALAGVVNFILDEDYTGFKANAQGGITSQGDGESFLGSFTAGLPFAEGRGHFLFNYEHAYQSDIPSLDRSWGKTSYAFIGNPNYTPDNGQPRNLTVTEAGLSVATRGGLIVNCPSAPGTSCPLRGTQFLEGGVPGPFEFGSLISGPVMVGGDWQQSRVNTDMSLMLELKRDVAFSHVRYEVSEATTAYATVHWAQTEGVNYQSAPNFNLGNVTVLSGNPFIPDSVQAEMTANNIPSFTLGTTNYDLPNFGARNDRTLKRYVVGVEGEVNVLDSNWLWDAYYSSSSHDIISRSTNNQKVPFYHRAVDAVLDDGKVVCRINADADPTNDDPACYPYNPMGKGVNSQLAIDYVVGTGWAKEQISQNVAAISAAGEPFSSWAGPVSIAFGLEYRSEEVKGTASDLDEADTFLVANYHGSKGKYDVAEGFLETVVPLANGHSFAQLLDLNAAVRWTDYSTSGQVTTWKLGLNWAPVDDVRFRVTSSSDIRAPYLGELFDSGLYGAATPLDDPFSGTTHGVSSRTTGNPNLDPEEARTTGLGVVFTPSFLPGFAASVDYYDIDIEGAIATLGRDGYVNQCYAGDQALCAFIDFDAEGAVEFVNVQPANVNSQSTSGFDVEMSYGFPMSSISSKLGGDLSLRAFATFVTSLKTKDTFGNVVEGAGVNADNMGSGAGYSVFGPDSRYFVTATYDYDPFRATLTVRGIGSGVYNNSFIECSSNCPTSTQAHPTINNNHVDAVTYFDLAFNYSMFDGVAEAFVVVENVLDESPPLIAGGIFGPGSSRFYNGLGRLYRAGVRVSF